MTCYAWGREGKEYTIVGGKRVPTTRLYFNDINDADSHYWTLHLGIIWGFWPTDVKYEVQRLKAPAEFDEVYKASRWLVDDSKKTGILPGSYAPTFPEVNEKAAESRALATQIQARFITGEMALEEWDAAVKDYMSKYGYMADVVNKWIKENKDFLIKQRGVKVWNQ